jgi:hypothetical protein
VHLVPRQLIQKQRFCEHDQQRRSLPATSRAAVSPAALPTVDVEMAICRKQSVLRPCRSVAPAISRTWS